MNLDKAALTLYDFLGYLLPGYVLIFVSSLVESTFLNTALLSLSTIGKNLLIATVAAYFLGQASHRVASLGRDWNRRIRKGKNRLTGRMNDNRLHPAVYGRVLEEIKDAYSLDLAEGDKLGGLDIYLLADSYVVASGASPERDMLMAREGFFKTSMVAFGIMFLVFVGSLLVGGLKIQSQPGAVTQMNSVATGLVALAALGLAALFRTGFNFYNQIKSNNIRTIFLALRSKDKLNKKG